jgi:dTMP kinase
MGSKKPGLFITLEGPDGSGKSTQMKLLVERLRRERIKFCRTREPGGGSKSGVAEKIRRLLLSPHSRGMTAQTELLLFLASRSQHVQEVILPACSVGKVVVCERFSDATLAYQVGGRGLPEKVVRSLDEFATQGLRPDLTLLLDMPAQQGLVRAYSAKSGHDRLEAESFQFHERVRKAYLSLARQEPDRIKRIAARQPADKVHAILWGHVRATLARSRAKVHAV